MAARTMPMTSEFSPVKPGNLDQGLRPIWPGMVCQAAVGTPLRAFVDRLKATLTADCPWREYLPPGASFRDFGTTHAGGIDFRSGFSMNSTQLECGPPNVAGRVWQLSQDPMGCRLVQKALEESSTDCAREAIAFELRGHVWEAMRCPHSNHVLQKCAVTLPPKSLQFIIDEISKGDGVMEAARHKYGCRIVQRLFENCPTDQIDNLREEVLSNIKALAIHAYGNYVVQNLLAHGHARNRTRIFATVLGNLGIFARDPNGVSVVGTSLATSEGEEQRTMAQAIVRGPGVLVAMACSRHGRSSVEHLLEHSPIDLQQDALKELLVNSVVLAVSRYGRQVLEMISK